MGQTISGLVNSESEADRMPEVSYVEPKTLEDIELGRFGEGAYDDRTRSLIEHIDIERGIEVTEEIVLVPSNYRDAFKVALDVVIQESFEDDGTPFTCAIEWWIIQMWFLIEWLVVVGDYNLRQTSLSTLEQFQIMVEIRDHKRHSLPGDVLLEYVRILRNLVDMPNFGLSRAAISLFSILPRTEGVSDIPPELQYLNQMVEWQPIEEPKTVIEIGIKNLPLKSIEEVAQAIESAECAICREVVEAGTEVTVLEPFCSHWFHTGCIHYVLRSTRGTGTRVCPVCRTQIILAE